MNCNEPEKILASLPKEYTVEMSLQNQDVLYTPEGKSYNVDRLHEFMSNVQKGYPDCIILTVFGLEPPATTAVLYYDGDEIAYTFDITRINKLHEIKTVYGTDIFAITHKPSQFIETIYYLEVPGEDPWFVFRDYLDF